MSNKIEDVKNVQNNAPVKPTVEVKKPAEPIKPEDEAKVKVEEAKVADEVKVPTEQTKDAANVKVDTTTPPETTQITPPETKPEDKKVEDKVDVVGVASLTDLFKQLHQIDESKILETFKAFKSDKLEENLFVAELIDVHSLLSVNTASSVSSGNGRLNSLILRVLDSEDRVRFDIINKLFDMSKVIYEPSYLQREINFTRSSEVAVNYGLLITIIEILSNPETRKENKKLVANLGHLKIASKSINFLKSYYQL